MVEKLRFQVLLEQLLESRPLKSKEDKIDPQVLNELIDSYPVGNSLEEDNEIHELVLKPLLAEIQEASDRDDIDSCRVYIVVIQNLDAKKEQEIELLRTAATVYKNEYERRKAE